jgi:3-hydroxyisobutyrate dehydrogenase
LNLLKAGHSVSIYNRTASRTERLAAAGAKVALTPAAAADSVMAEVICVMVSGPDDVREVVLGAGGVITGAPKGSVIVDFSTIGPAATEDIALACDSAGLGFLSVPVTGSRPSAEAGSLTLLVGGPEKAREIAMPVLQAVGQKMVLLDTPVKAQALKLCMNQTFALAVHALVEGAELADRSGVSKAAYFEGVGASMMANPLFALKGKALANGDFNQIFSLALMAKDLELGSDMAKTERAYLPLTAALREVYRGALAQGLGEKDYVATALFLDRASGKQ